MRAGQELIIPRAPTALLASRVTREPEATLASRGPAAPATPASATSTSAENDPALDESRIVYRVKRGDTLSSIAREFDTTVAAIKRSNRLRSNKISTGDRLTILTRVGTRASTRAAQ